MYSIYKITNKVNGKSYIGFSKKVKERIASHIALSTRKPSNQLIHKAIRKYGMENFYITILECGMNEHIGLIVREPYWITLLSPQYNLTKGGEGRLGHITTMATREKISKSNRGKTLGIKRAPFSVEHKANIRAAKKGVSVGPFTEEHRRKLSDNKKKYWKNYREEHSSCKTS